MTPTGAILCEGEYGARGMDGRLGDCGPPCAYSCWSMFGSEGEWLRPLLPPPLTPILLTLPVLFA